MISDIFNKYDWSGFLHTWAEQVSLCDSEKDLYRKLKKFKEDFGSYYGKISRKQAKLKGICEKDERQSYDDV